MRRLPFHHGIHCEDTRAAQSASAGILLLPVAALLLVGAPSFALAEGEQGTPAGPAPAEGPRTGAATEAASTAAPQPHPERTEQEVDRCTARHSLELTLPAAQERAARRSGVSVDQVRQAESSARLKALLPRVNLLGVYRGDSESSDSVLLDRLYPMFTDYKDKSMTEVSGERFYLGGLLTFNLGALVLGKDAVEVSVKAAQYRNELAQRVAELAARRDAAVLELCSRQWPHLQRRRLALEVRRHTDALLGLVGGP